MNIENLGLQPSTLKRLQKHGFKTVGKLLDYAFDPYGTGEASYRGLVRILALKNIGKKSYYDLLDRLEHRLHCKFTYR